MARRLGLIIIIMYGGLLAGCPQMDMLSRTPRLPEKVSPNSKEFINWKAVLMTGDNEIDAFDNGRKKLAVKLQEHGIRPENIKQLSMKKDQQVEGVRQSSRKNFAKALKSLKLKKGDGCLVHITSHGTPEGVFMRDQSPLSPFQLHRTLNRYCKKLPTVVMVSGCYTGVFTSKTLQRTSRAIFTAARDDRTSFGCGVDNVYTFWDGCLLEELDRHSDWDSLYGAIDQCIATKEIREKVEFQSYPQFKIGKGMKRISVFNAKIDNPPPKKSPAKKDRKKKRRQKSVGET